MRIAPAITITEEQERQLQSWARGRSVEVRLAQRARMILFAANRYPRFRDDGGGEGTIEATLVVRPQIRRIKICSPTLEHRRRFAQPWEQSTGIEVVPVNSAEAAVRDVDIVVGATNSFTPVLPASCGGELTTID